MLSKEFPACNVFNTVPMLFFLIPTSTHLTGPAAPQDPWFGGETSVKKLLHPYTAGKKGMWNYIFKCFKEFKVSTRDQVVFSLMGRMRKVKDKTKYKPSFMSYIYCRIVQALNQGWVSLCQSLHKHRTEDGLWTLTYAKETITLWFGPVLSCTFGQIQSRCARIGIMLCKTWWRCLCREQQKCLKEQKGIQRTGNRAWKKAEGVCEIGWRDHGQLQRKGEQFWLSIQVGRGEKKIIKN